MYKLYVIFIILVGQLSASQVLLTEQEKLFINNNPVITLGGGESFEPYLIKNQNGTLSGYDIDILKLIEEKTGLNIEVKLGNWADIQNQSKMRALDGLCTTNKSDKRAKYYNFSNKYFTYTPLVIIKEGNPKNIYAYKDLEGKTVAIQKENHGFENIAKSLRDIKILYYDSMHDLIKAVVSSEVDFTIFEETAFYLASEIGLESFIDHSITIGETQEMVFCLRNDSPELLSIVNKGLNAISIVEYKEIRDKWMGRRVSQKQISEVSYSSKEKAYLNEKKVIKMCVDPDWMPFTKILDGKQIGMSADLNKLISERLPIPIELVQTDIWSETLDFAKQRKCDIVDLAVETPSRKKYLNFTSTFINVPLIIVTKYDVRFINDIKTLKNKEIAIPKGYAFIEILKQKHPFLNIVEVGTIHDGLQMVKDGILFGYIGTLPSVAYSFKENFTGELKVTGKLDFTLDMGSAVRDDDQILFNIMQKAISSIPQEDIDNIINKWITVSYEEKVDYTLLKNILIVIGILISLFLYRYYILNRAKNKLEFLVANKTKEITSINKNLELKITQEVEKSKRIEKQLFESEKLASMGEMIGNIAHQWRQPLATISMDVANMKVSKELDELSDREFLESCDSIEKNAQYLSTTIDDFRKYIKADRKQTLFSLKDELESVKHLVESSLKSHYIILTIELESDIQIYGYENDLLQCFINIINNAQDALIDKDDNKYVLISVVKRTDSIELSIKDSGGGISKNIIDKIFEPYFTTKHKSQGTGLGLHMTYDLIVNGMNGAIEVNNINFEHNGKKLQGAEFIISLPISKV